MTSETKRLTCVSDSDTLALPLSKDGTLNINVLRSYFKDGIGLKFRQNQKDNVLSAVAIAGQELIIEKFSEIHYVVTQDKGKHGLDQKSSLDQVNSLKRQKMEEILTVIEGAPLHKIVKKNQPNLQKPSFAIKISWKHKKYTDKTLQLQKEHGIDLQIDLTENEYSYDIVLAKCKSLFYNDASKKVFDTSKVTLGYIGKSKQHEIIEEFPEDDVRKFFIAKNKVGYRKKLYVFSESKDASEIYEDFDNLPIFNVGSKMRGSSTHENIDECNVIRKKTLEEQKQLHQAYEKSLIILNDRSIINSRPKEMDPRIKCNSFQINYSYVRRIVKSNKWECVSMPKPQLYAALKRDGEIPSTLKYEKFSPADRQFNVSQIYVNGHMLLNIEMISTLLDRTFHYGTYSGFGPPLSGKDHQLIYGCDVLRGMCHDGNEFGLGAIPRCNDRCEPEMTWLRNGEVFAQGKNLFWITCNPNEDPWQNLWECRIQCSMGDNDSSSEYVTETNSIPKKLPVNNMIPETISKITNDTVGSSTADNNVKTSISSPGYSVITRNKSETVHDKENHSLSGPNCVASKHQKDNENNNNIINLVSLNSVSSIDQTENNKIFKVPQAAEKQKNCNSKLEEYFATNNCKIRLPLIDSKDIKIHKGEDAILGEGGQGKVLKGKWNGTTNVAVKQIKFKQGNFGLAMLKSEVKLLDFLNHPNIIQTLGFCLSNTKLNIVMELVDGMSLKDIIFEEVNNLPLPFQDISKKKAKVLDQVCQAISYMHTRQNPIVHADIKPDNIMITRNWTAKICDFGLSRVQYYVNTGTSLSNVHERTGAGTVVYMAPELLFNNEVSTIFSDIWALGCTFVETYKGYETWQTDPSKYISRTELFSILKKGKKPDIEKVPALIRSYVADCFSTIPKDRPSAGIFCTKYCEYLENWSNDVIKVTTSIM